MHQPYTGETFVGSRLGAELRGRGPSTTLRVRECRRLEDAIVCATDPAMFSGPGERDAFRQLASKARMRRYGGDCYSYCLLAAGFIDLVIESSLQPYDIQPLIPIIEAAGGIVTSWSGGPPYDGGQISRRRRSRAAQNRARDAGAGRAIADPHCVAFLEPPAGFEPATC